MGCFAYSLYSYALEGVGAVNFDLVVYFDIVINQVEFEGGIDSENDTKVAFRCLNHFAFLEDRLVGSRLFAHQPMIHRTVRERLVRMRALTYNEF